MHHELKTLTQYYQAIKEGRKTFEIRYNDRGFQFGDTVTLVEIDEQGTPTGNRKNIFITYVTNFEQKDDYVVFGFKNLARVWDNTSIDAFRHAQEFQLPHDKRAQAYFDGNNRGRLGSNYLDLAMTEIQFLRNTLRCARRKIVPCHGVNIIAAEIDQILAERDVPDAL